MSKVKEKVSQQNEQVLQNQSQLTISYWVKILESQVKEQEIFYENKIAEHVQEIRKLQTIIGSMYAERIAL